MEDAPRRQPRAESLIDANIYELRWTLVQYGEFLLFDG